ncbi:unnamed protein product, partial [Effrenium voratum]
DMSVALIGSSGGGAATLGHNDAAELLRVIHEELQKTEGCSGLGFVLFSSMSKGFDAADPGEKQKEERAKKDTSWWV